MSTATMTNLNKIIRPGSMKIGKRQPSIFCHIEIKDGKLSISGVVGPLSNGDAVGSCGQIAMGFEHRNPLHNDRRYSHLTAPSEITFAEGWDAERWLTFLDIWHEHHLNDMKANCEHQIGPDWTPRDVTIYYFRTQKHVCEAVRAFKRRAEAALKTGETVTPTAEETRLSLLPDKISSDQPELAAELAGDYEPNGPQYTGDQYNKPSEVKATYWLNEAEHPAGYLSKPCPVCGYKYGTAWRSRPVPAEAIEFLEHLPETDRKPAWV